jgi:hypothetical protein
MVDGNSYKPQSLISSVLRYINEVKAFREKYDTLELISDKVRNRIRRLIEDGTPSVINSSSSSNGQTNEMLIILRTCK